jgi:hypothetical protein
MILTSGKITVSGRKLPEIDGKQKQYSRPEGRKIIPTTSGRFVSYAFSSLIIITFYKNSWLCTNIFYYERL